MATVQQAAVADHFAHEIGGFLTRRGGALAAAERQPVGPFQYILYFTK
jgi:hypothetical protein